MYLVIFVFFLIPIPKHLLIGIKMQINFILLIKRLNYYLIYIKINQLTINHNQLLLIELTNMRSVITLLPTIRINLLNMLFTKKYMSQTAEKIIKRLS